MADEPDNIFLIYLRRIDEKLDRLIDEVRDLKVGTTGVEEGMAGVNPRIDRFDMRLDRIERRLDLVDAHSRRVMSKSIHDSGAIPDWLTHEAIERTQGLGRQMAMLLHRRNEQAAINPNAKVRPHAAFLGMFDVMTTEVEDTIVSRLRSVDGPAEPGHNGQGS